VINPQDWHRSSVELRLKALIQRMDINIHRWETGERQVIKPQDWHRSSVELRLKALIQLFASMSTTVNW